MMPKHKIEVNSEKCSGCRRCVLACSEADGFFNQERSRVLVQAVGDDFMIEYREDCTGCGTCVKQCLYGALVKGEKIP